MRNATLAIVLGFAVLVLVIVLVLQLTPSHAPPPVGTQSEETEVIVANQEIQEKDNEDIDPAAAYDGSAVFNQGAEADANANYHAAMTTRPEMEASRDRPDRMTRYHGSTDGILKAAGRGHEKGDVGAQVALMFPMSS